MIKKANKIAVENINVPSKINNIDAVKYKTMKKAFLKISPTSSLGLTQKEIQEQVIIHLPESVFPQGAASGWWAKTVQLDLEAKRVVTQEACKPLRWYKLTDQ